MEKAHFKLWLSSTAALESIFDAASKAYENIVKEDILRKIKVFAPNPSFTEAQQKLAESHVLIVSGAPGVGKTTLAEMVANAYMADGWELTVIKNLDDGFAKLHGDQKRVFYFDDFLGKIALDRQALSQRDSHLAQFIKKVRASANARFILTTRAYIFEEARRVSEYMADKGLNISKYVLDVSLYTRRIKARILYNHLLLASISAPKIDALITSGLLPEIVDHPNYNPRIIEWMTDKYHVGEVAAEQYPEAFIETLDHPEELWDKAFRSHISKSCQHLLITLFFVQGYSISIATLKSSYQKLHPKLCAYFGYPHDPKDFDESLKILEGGFIKIEGTMVRFVNPSIGDYLSGYLKEPALLELCAQSSSDGYWASAVWRHTKQSIDDPETRKELCLAFREIAPSLSEWPVWKKKVRNGMTHYSPCDISNTDRIRLLIEWWQSSGDTLFANQAKAIASKPIDGFSSWRDKDALELLIELDGHERYARFPEIQDLKDNLLAASLEMIECATSDDLEEISDACEEHNDELPPAIVKAVSNAISNEISNASDTISYLDSESELEDYKRIVRRLSDRVSVLPWEVENICQSIDERISELSENYEASSSPATIGKSPPKEDNYDDNALKGLFSTLAIAKK